MGGVGVQHGPEVATTRQARTRKLWLGVAAAIAIAVLVLIAQRTQLLAWLEPRFQVAEVNPVSKTITLRRANHTYRVECGDACGIFQVGESYRMELLGDRIRCHMPHREIYMRVLEEETQFTTPGGHG